jgi:uncharacterized protein (TIGR03067 family)
MKAQTLIALTAALFLAGPAPGNEGAKSNQKMLQGTWSLVSVEINKQSVPMGNLKESRLLVKGVKYCFTLEKIRLEMTHEVDSSKSPKWLDMTVVGGPQKGKTYHAIFKLEGDTLTICRDTQPDKERPAEFSTESSSGLMLIVWKRVKP